jgi:hypothetical protein
MNSVVKNRNIIGKRRVSSGFLNQYYIDFDGVTQYVKCGSGVYQPTVLQDFSFGFWVFGLMDISLRVPISYSFNDAGFSILAQSGQMWLRLGNISKRVSTGVLGWTHLIYNIDRSNALGYGANMVILYKNGVYSLSGAAGTNALNYTFQEFTIGKHSAYAQYYNKFIDEVCMFDKVLTPAQAAALYGAGVTAPGNANDIGDVEGYWRFENDLLDSSGNGHNGTPVGLGCPDYKSH